MNNDCPFGTNTTTIESIEWPDDDSGNVEMKTVDGWVFAGMKRKDFYCPDECWEKRLVPGTQVRSWTMQLSIPVVFQWLKCGGWSSFWFCGNDFQPKAERDAAAEAYSAAGERAAEAITAAIDAGAGMADVEQAAEDAVPGLTGFMIGWAMAQGVGRASNRDNAEKIRAEWNGRFGNDDPEGVVNPALLTVGPSEE